MAHDAEKDFNRRIAERVGRLVANAREGFGGRRMTAQALANRTAELGHPLDRSVIAKLEKGFRQTVTVADLLVLARALDVPPVTLLFPVAEAEVEVLPGDVKGMWPALQWFAAEAPYPSADQQEERWEPPAALRLFREHEAFVDLCMRTGRAAADKQFQATLADGDERKRLEVEADVERQMAVGLRDLIRGMRRSLRSLNHEPPPLPEALRSLDEDVD
ncbi:helix-turn-helix domain-containing protein [Streptomyces collinus]|uniref:helix-turn-helix domain-containing protein n=1 Tax=Streptomyces collinus TaxID=42684 RepID=UPI0038215FBF